MRRLEVTLAGIDHAVVIGAGLGGLSCAARLASAGVRVTVLEGNARVGGKVGGDRWDGFTVDFAPHLFSMGSAGELARVCRMLDEPQRFVVRNPVARVRLGSREFAFPARFDSPRDAASLVLRAGIRPSRLLGAGRHFLQMAMGAPDLERHGADTTLQQWVSRYTDDPTYHTLINLFSILAFVLPYDVTSAVEMARCMSRIVRGPGIGYPEGGCLGLVEAITRGVRRAGAQVELNRPVDRIETHRGRVRAVWCRGERRVADAVFSNAGVRRTVELVGAEAVGDRYARRARGLVNSMAGVMIRYTLDTEVIDSPVLFAMPKTPAADVARRIGEGRIVDAGMGYYATVPTHFDPGLAPPGGQIVIAGTAFYPEVPGRAGLERMLLGLERRLENLYPRFADAIIRREPTTQVHVAAASGRRISGEAVGVAQIPGQVGAGRPTRRTPIRGLYVVGADTAQGAIGTELAAMSGLAAAEEAIDRS